jgi:hypothetical protein
MFSLYKATTILNSIPTFKTFNEQTSPTVSPGKKSSQQHNFSPKKDKKLSQ